MESFIITLHRASSLSLPGLLVSAWCTLLDILPHTVTHREGAAPRVRRRRLFGGRGLAADQREIE